MTDPVLVDLSDGISTVTLADEANKNALGADLVDQIRGAVANANSDSDTRAIVVTNTSNTFCAGANLKERSANTAQASDSNGFERLLSEIQSSPTPVIGRIAGHVVGGGLGLAAVMDISVAANDVRFGFTEVRLGVAPAMISVVCLPKMRRGEALEAFLRGTRFSADRAVELGLINHAVDRDNLDAEVSSVLDDVLRGGPLALAAAKRLVYDVPAMEQSEAFAHTAEISGQLFASDEAAAGMKAFLERTDAPWIPDEN
ncbi:MAG: enoyl-CoA hydratase-related protein [Acidimicrobiales bacterium]